MLCPCGPLIRVGTVEVWGNVDETIASKFFLLCLSGDGEKERGPLPTAKPHQYLEDGGQPLDGMLRSPM